MKSPAIASGSLLKHFALLEDPRVEYLVEHRLLDIIALIRRHPQNDENDAGAKVDAIERSLALANHPQHLRIEHRKIPPSKRQQHSRCMDSFPITDLRMEGTD